MVKLFVDAWHECHPDIEIVLMNDINDPVSDSFGLREFPSFWSCSNPQGNNVICSLMGVVKSTRCDAVIKLDVDCVHRRINGKNWLDDYDLSMPAMGHQLAYNYDVLPANHRKDMREMCFYGAGYVLRADAVSAIGLHGGAGRHRFEDVSISKTAHEIYGDDVNLFSNLHPIFRGYRPDSDLTDCQFIHCGQSVPRCEVKIVMRSLIAR